jgi:hypothetical protein
LFCRLRGQRVDHSNYRLGGPCIDGLQDFQWGILHIKAGHRAGLFVSAWTHCFRLNHRRYPPLTKHADEIDLTLNAGFHEH